MVTRGSSSGKIGTAVLVLKANAKGLKEGLGKAQKETSSRVKKMQASFQGFARRIPVVGGALAGLATPAGLATAAIALTVGALTKMVTKTLDLGRSLGTARETLGVSAESIQIYRRAIEETNGDAKAFDQSVLRLTRSIGEAGTGNKQYQEDFERIGLSYVDLAEMSPEDALKAVTGAINEQLGPADGAAVKAALLGRGYAGMGGFANLTTQEIADLTDSVADSAVVMGGEGVTNVDNFDASWRKIRDGWGKAQIQIGQKLVPLLTKLFDFISNEAVPAVMSLWNAVSPILLPALKALGSFMGGTLKGVFETIKGVILIVSGVLTGDFSQAWEGVKSIAVGALRQIAAVYNNTLGLIPGLAKIDMSIVEESLLGVQESAEAVEPAVEDMTDAMGNAGTQAVDTAEAIREAEAADKAHAEAIRDSIEAIKDRIAKEQEHLTSLGLTKAAVVAAEIALRALNDAEREGIVTAAGFTGETQAVTLALLSKEEAIREAEAAETAHAEAIRKSEEATEAAIKAAEAHAEAIRDSIDAIKDRIESEAKLLDSLELTKAQVVAATIAIRSLTAAQRENLVVAAGFTGQTQAVTLAGQTAREREARAAAAKAKAEAEAAAAADPTDEPTDEPTDRRKSRMIKHSH